MTARHAASCTCREHPLPSSMNVREARDAYLAENGFTAAAYDEPWTAASFLGVGFSVPNTKRHAWALRRHDLHHVATGFGTDLAGEGEISCWETRRGLKPLGVYTAGIVASGASLGLVLSPRVSIAALRERVVERSLFVDDGWSYEELLAMTVGELRRWLGVPEDGIATKRELHAKAPAAISAPTPRPQNTRPDRPMTSGAARSASD